ncbi:hypothetical protein BU17DRAFT_49245 [Hysterangium stoloniferum]|nr:hypothetical protein BU17DRAFT_49245 [Hysterangium stoloniferum]
MSRSSTPSPPPTLPSSDSEDGYLTATSSKSGHHQSNRGKIFSSLSQPHPFAASTKANRPPPSYEKKFITPPSTPPDFNPNVSSGNNDEKSCSSKPPAPRTLRPSLSGTKEQRVWERTISSAVDKAEIKIDLSASGLTFIPPSILDLNNVVVLPTTDILAKSSTLRPFSRSLTVPASSKSFLRSSSTSTLSPSPSTRADSSKVELYLMTNKIRKLPRELFALDCLVVLSLRGNKLDSLPPAIGRLSSLRELNIANNHITYLPAEIQQLRLTSLHLHPNPFLRSPTYAAQSDVLESEKCRPSSRKLGTLERKCTVPTLSELSLRHLLTPIRSSVSSLTLSRLERSMDPSYIDALKLPLHIRRILRASTGHGREQRDEKGFPLELDPDMDISMNVCPSPRHHSAVFSDPVEERLEWVSIVATVPLGEEVPLMWRGCAHGCLDFLDGVHKATEVLFEAAAGSDGEEFQFSDDED